jgi:hypothetical protein
MFSEQMDLMLQLGSMLNGRPRTTIPEIHRSTTTSPRMAVDLAMVRRLLK